MPAPDPDERPNSFRDEYMRRIGLVVDFISANLWQDITIDDLAGISHFSRAHFDRIFLDATGETVTQRIGRLRDEAARRKRRNGARSNGRSARFFNPPDTLDDEMAKNASVRIVEMHNMHIACVRFIGPYLGIGKAFSTLFCWAVERQLLKPDALIMGVYHDMPEITSPDQLRSDACITVPIGTETAAPVSTRPFLCAGDYAVGHFEFKNVRYFPRVWRYMTSQWIPASGCQIDERPMFEIYRGDPMMMDNVFRVDICVPVRPL